MLYIKNCPKGNHHRASSPSPYYVIIDEFDRRWLRVSREFAGLLGYKAEELLGTTAQQMMKAKYNPSLFDGLLQNESLEVVFDFRHKTGKEISMMVRLRLLEDGCILGTATPY